MDKQAEELALVLVLVTPLQHPIVRHDLFESLHLLRFTLETD